MTLTYALDLDRREYVVQDANGTEVFADGWERRVQDFIAEDADECERPDDAPNVDWLVPTP